ncbi:2-oxo acid dehydrogenase subunit E2 [Persicimonas caeni]|uniref:Dihydrolipoamide acetyltransferase component of pyruvate dehydrogenase complex n=1 Tax=Persicimonas caeni TaxID=2292766 RepID=A0A4Y6PT64_PERCE|nr:dihydrolipoamide acetyltransferase family protein [Persicimonas caeni]QDG51524.1 2-oxo acid dehydrogenase subunit E2 [Persicimonas caeni]QED32745.1 2-oxo acid dehydrogenase subunit E2 [Persicimonas caeni]
MRTEVVMPQMGESVAEGTVTTWLKEIGDFVERDEPLFEITTDKVDAEVPSPVAGVLVEKHVEPGQTVEINTIVAVVDTEAQEGEVPAAEPAQAAQSVGDEESNVVSLEEEKTTRQVAAAGGSASSVTADAGGFPSKAELRRTRSTPVVRRIAAEHGIDDLSPIPGSGLSGRVTKDDILEWIDQGKHLEKPAAPAAQQARKASTGGTTTREIHRPDIEVGERDKLEMLTPQRKMIAEHMVASKEISPHAHTVHEVDFSNVVAARKALKADFAERGVKLTYTAFLIKAAAEALREYPTVNASMDDESIVLRGDINVGMAVALDKSLIVPVIDNVDELSLLGVARKVNDIADRARNKRLKPDEVKGGTFTLSNHGVFGPEFGIPIINQPQAAIMSTGAIKKRVVVDQKTDAILVRPTSIWCLSFDHRIIDGATADKFMRRMREIIENWAI